jgi:hypothetical protein
MTVEGDELLAMIRTELRRRRVPPSDLDLLTEIVGRTVVAVMSTPKFYDRLRVVLELRQENELLRYHLASTQAMLNRLVKSRMPTTKPKPKPRKKAAPRKSPVVKKAPGVRVKGSTAANRKAFREGYGGP